LSYRAGDRISAPQRKYSHSFAYKLAGEGKIRFVKLGGKTLVDMAYSRPYFAVSMDE
jgi:hypothetical protein